MFLLLILGVIIFMVVLAMKKKKAAVGAGIVPAVVLSGGRVPAPSGFAPAPPYSPAPVSPGIAGVQMSKRACKDTCKSVCGRKPLIAIGKKAKAKKAAWQECDAQCTQDVCGW